MVVTAGPFDKTAGAADNALHQKEAIMRHTILVATLSSIAASVLTTALVSGSFFGADTARSANTDGATGAAVQSAGVDSILQGDVDCGGNVSPVDSLKTLRHDAGLSVQQDEPCPDIGTLAAIPGPPGPAGPQGPQGEAGPRGINLWATVRDDGTLIRGTATGAARPETGVYIVTFAQDVSGCAAIANSGLSDGGMSFASDAIASTVNASFLVGEAEVAVVFQNPLDRINTDFNLIVTC
ncbi:MAG TPA: hypothetical protein VIW01_13370 [Dehalococcoidia bacterium]